MSYIEKAIILAMGLAPFGFLLAENPPRTAWRALADTRQTGRPDTRLEPGASSDGFAIALPLPQSIADLEAVDFDKLRGRLTIVRLEGISPKMPTPLRCSGIEAGAIRVYHKANRKWIRNEPREDQSFAIRSDDAPFVEIGIAIAPPHSSATQNGGKWPTQFRIEIGERSTGSQWVSLPFRVAPFIVPNALDPVDEILIVDRPSTQVPLAALKPLALKLGVNLTTHAGNHADVWMQDTIEFGQHAMPAATGPEQFPAVLTGVRREFGFGADKLDEQMRKMLIDRGFVRIDPGPPRKLTRWIDWYGNLEASPPHFDRNNKAFPYGRILTGKQDKLEMHPGVMQFLQYQRVQWPPIVIDTSWLMIGHVDEVVNFVPAKNRAGFRVLLPSPKAAREVLDRAMQRNLGHVAVFAGTRRATTVAQLRDSIAGSSENAKIDRIIASVQDQLKSELNLSDDDFVHVPVLFDRGGAVIPNAVNSLIANGHMLAPDPRGPRHDGQDLLAEAIRTALSDCDVQVSFVDVWDAYHSRGGELHCGTNTIRRLRDPAWWKHDNAAPSKDLK